MREEVSGRLRTYVDYRSDPEEPELGFNIVEEEKDTLDEACRRSDLRGGC